MPVNITDWKPPGLQRRMIFDVEIIRPVVIDYDRLANDATDRPPDTVGKPSNSLGL